MKFFIDCLGSKEYGSNNYPWCVLTVEKTKDLFFYVQLLVFPPKLFYYDALKKSYELVIHIESYNPNI